MSNKEIFLAPSYNTKSNVYKKFITRNNSINDVIIF